jgi:hypothetical protein
MFSWMRKINMNNKNGNKLMKTIIPLLAISVLAALALVGCNQGSTSNATETSSPNSSMADTNGMMGGTTNMMASNGMPNMNANMMASNGMPNINTNMMASNGMPGMNTNMPPSTNQ